MIQNFPLKRTTPGATKPQPNPSQTPSRDQNSSHRDTQSPIVKPDPVPVVDLEEDLQRLVAVCGGTLSLVSVPILPRIWSELLAILSVKRKGPKVLLIESPYE